MKKLIFTIVCLIGLTTIAQNREIEFTPGDWKSHLETAKNDNKVIFFDAYTTWCGPCKLMARDVFTNDEVADLFNDKFVNVKFDMEKGEGIFLHKNYEVSAFPTYLFINGDGEVVHKIVGSMSAEEFLKEANNALNPENTLYGLSKKFETSGTLESVAVAYLDALDKAYDSKKMSIVSKKYFDEIEKSTLLDEHNWELALKYLNNPSSKAFAYLYKNKQLLEDKYKENIVKRYFQQTFSESVYMIKSSFENKKGVKEAKENMKAIRKLLKKENSYSKVVLAKLDLIEYADNNKWDKYAVKVYMLCADPNLSKITYVVIDAAHDVVSAEQEKQYENVLKWANLIENTQPELFTNIQLAELRKRVLIHQGKTADAEEMFQKEKGLRQEAADKRLMTPPLRKD